MFRLFRSLSLSADRSFGFDLVDYFVFEVFWFSRMRTAFGGSGGRMSLDWRMEGGRIAEGSSGDRSFRQARTD